MTTPSPGFGALAAELRLSWSTRRHRGFFLRAEDFFGYLRMQARTDARILREKAEFRGERFDHEGPSSGGIHLDEVNAVRHLPKFDGRSHGESFLELFERRVERHRGLYLLDEPETPLSPKRQLALLKLIIERSEEGAQFVIATHSPILLACPGARIYSFDGPPIHEVEYDTLEHVTVMRDFLNDREGQIAKLV